MAALMNILAWQHCDRTDKVRPPGLSWFAMAANFFDIDCKVTAYQSDWSPE